MQKKQISMLVAMMFAGVGIAHAAGGGNGANFVDRSNPDNPISGSNSSINGQLPGSIGTKSGDFVAVSTAVYTAGNNSKAGSGGIAIGDRANANVNSVGNADNNGGATAIGVGAQALNNSAMAFGTVALASGNSAIAVGRQSAAVGDFSIGMGNVADAHGQRSIALGSSAQAADDQSIAIGSSTGGANDGVSAGATFDSATNTQAKGKRSVALGAGARTNGDDQVAIGANSVGAANNTKPMFGQSAPVGGSVSFGKLGSERQLKNVAAGADATDAVNVAQLSNVNSSLSTAIDSTNSRAVQYDDPLNHKSVTLTGATSTDGGVTNGTKITNVAQGAVNAKSTDAINGAQLFGATKDAVQYDSAAHNSVTLGGAGASAPVGLHNVAAGTANTDAVNVGQIKPLQTSLSTAASDIGNLQGSVSNINTSLSTTVQSVSSLSTSVTSINSSLSTATTDIGNLQQADTRNVKYDGASGFDTVTLKGTNGTTISNVADGVADHDAANVGQLKSGISTAISTSNSYTDTQVSNLSTSVGSNINTQISNLSTSVMNQIGAATKNAVQYDGDNHASVTLGGANASAPVGLHNVSDGVANNDAVNFGQLSNVQSGLQSSISTTNSNVSNLSTSVSNIGEQVTTNTTNIETLQQADTRNVKYDGAAGFDSVTLAGANGTQVKNVADGTDTHDAVNVGQLTKATGDLSTSISNVDQRVTNVSNTLSTSISNIDARTTTNETNISGLQKDALQWSQSLGAYDASHGSGAPQKITNVAAGDVSASSTDAINGAQLKSVQDQINNNVGQATKNAVQYDTNPDGSRANSVTLAGGDATKPVTISNVADGVKANDAVNVGQLGKATDGLQSQINTTNNNVTTLGDQVNTNTTNITNLQQSDALSVKYDSSAKDSVTLGGVGAAAPVKLSNVADGVANNDAVNVGQLTKTAGGLQTQIDTTNSNVTTLGNQVTQNTTNISNNTAAISGLQQNTLQFDPSVGAYNASRDGVATKIVNVADGNVAPGSKDAVNGGQLSGVQSTLEQQITNVSNTTGEKLKNVVTYDTNAHGDRTGSITLDPRDGVGTKITHVRAGTLSAKSQDAVNGSQLYATNQTVAAQGQQITSIDGRVTTNTNNIAGLQQDALQWNSSIGGYDASHGSGSAQQIKNVAAGTDDTDAVNVKQLKGVQSSVDQLGALAVQYDDSSKATITLGGANGTKITNVQAGTLSATSTDAVNGSQLYATNQQVSKNTTDITNLQENVTNIQNGKAGLVQQQDPNGQITVGAGTGGTSVNFSGTQGDRTLTGVAAGVNVNDAVNKGQLDSAISNVSGNVTNIQNQTNANSAWISRADAGSIGSTATATGKNSVAVGQGSVADRDNSFSVGAKGSERQVTNVAAGTAPTDAVNVQQLNDNLAASSASSQSYTDQRVGQVYNDLNTVKKDMYGGVASALAVAGLPQPTGAGRSMVSAATSNYHGQQGFAAGYSYVTENNKWVVKASVTGNTRSDFGAVVGAGYQW